MEFYWSQNGLGNDLHKRAGNGNIHVANFFNRASPIIYDNALYEEAKKLWENGQLRKPN